MIPNPKEQACFPHLPTPFHTVFWRAPGETLLPLGLQMQVWEVPGIWGRKQPQRDTPTHKFLSHQDLRILEMKSLPCRLPSVAE
jgi:hypothetical protein